MSYPNALGDRTAYKKLLRIMYPLPSTPEGWCKMWRKIDRTFATPADSSLHHDARCLSCALA